MENEAPQNQPEGRKAMTKWEPFYDRDFLPDAQIQAGCRFIQGFRGPFSSSMQFDRRFVETFLRRSGMSQRVYLQQLSLAENEGNNDSVGTDGAVARSRSPIFQTEINQTRSVSSLAQVRKTPSGYTIGIDGTGLRDMLMERKYSSSRLEKRYKRGISRLLKKSLRKAAYLDAIDRSRLTKSNSLASDTSELAIKLAGPVFIYLASVFSYDIAGKLIGEALAEAPSQAGRTLLRIIAGGHTLAMIIRDLAKMNKSGQLEELKRYYFTYPRTRQVFTSLYSGLRATRIVK